MFNRIKVLQILNLISFILMVGVNIIANTLPINGQTTGEVSAQYENLFTPARFVFSIWTVIYIGLTAFIIYQFKGGEKKGKLSESEFLVSYLGINFIFSCLANIIWIVSWHYEYVGLTLLCIGALLLILIGINRRLHAIANTVTNSKSFRWLVRIPFGLYLGWVSVATIANGAVYLTFQNWKGLSVSEGVWATLMIIIGGFIGLLLVECWKLFSSALAIAWGILGVIAHLWQYDEYSTIKAVGIMMIVLILAGAALTLRRKNRTISNPKMEAHGN